MISDDATKIAILHGIKLQMAQDVDLSLELFDMVFGDYIGHGKYRYVFDSRQYVDSVAKFEVERPSQANIKEYMVWQAVKETSLKEWFAPCYHLSINARILIQHKVEAITDENMKFIPRSIPAFFEDVKLENCGFMDGKFVFVDYPGTLYGIAEQGLTKMKPFKSHLKEKVFDGQQLELDYAKEYKIHKFNNDQKDWENLK